MAKEERKTRAFISWEWAVMLRERRGLVKADLETRFVCGGEKALDHCFIV